MKPMIKAYFKGSEHMTEVADETVQLAVSAFPSVEPSLFSKNGKVAYNQARGSIKRGYPSLGHFLLCNVPPIRNSYRLNMPEIERVLKPDGVFILNIGNPAISIENNVFSAELRLLYPYIVAEDITFRLSNLILQREHIAVLKNLKKKQIERWFIFSKTFKWKENKTKTPLILKGNIIHDPSAYVSGSETPFPQDILEFFVKKFTDENDWVLDAYAGLGTLGIIAARLHRNAILYENSLKPWKTLSERVAEAEANSSV